MKKLLLLTGLFLAACAPTTAPEETTPFEPTPPPPTIVVETNRPAVTTPAETTTAPSAVSATAATDAPPFEPETAVISGRTEEGAYFYGSPDAPVTLIDYSDFL